MSDQTRCVVAPEVNQTGFSSLAVPVFRASTIPFADAESYQNRHQRGIDGYSYGLSGTPTTRALEQMITELEGGQKTLLLPSGQAAIALSILSFVKAGEQILLPDTVYPPARDLADNELHRMGIIADFYDPTSLVDLERRIGSTTTLVWLESPGSTTMEVQDFRAVADMAHQAGALVGCDNTWATPLNFKPIQHGADIVVEALTKYFAGHSDVLMGSVTLARSELAQQLRQTMNRCGIGVSPDDCSLILRGIQTMPIRMNHVAEVALRLARWAEEKTVVASVLHPALPSSPGHEFWKRDFSGASGVFSVVFNENAAPYLNDALDEVTTFAIGASWGGTRSLLAPMGIENCRSVNTGFSANPILRISIGLEAEADLSADLERLFAFLEERANAGNPTGPNTISTTQEA